MFQHVGLFCSCEGRYCNQCGQVKCHRAFSKDAKGKFGLSSWCKECVKSHQQANLDRINERRRENRREKADHYNAYNREFHRRNPEPKKARDRQYRQEHAEEISATLRSWREHNAEYVKASKREWKRLHREEDRIKSANRRALKKQVGGSFTLQEWRDLCAYYDYTCLRCGRREPEIKLSADHVIPLSQGGMNSIDNIQPLCFSCNSSKWNKAIDYRVNWR